MPDQIHVSEQGVRRFNEKVNRLIALHLQYACEERIKEFELIPSNMMESRRRKERRKKKMLRELPLIYRGGKFHSKHLDYAQRWTEQHEIVDQAELNRIVGMAGVGDIGLAS